jgi:hypothetical protein
VSHQCPAPSAVFRTSFSNIIIQFQRPIWEGCILALGGVLSSVMVSSSFLRPCTLPSIVAQHLHEAMISSSQSHQDSIFPDPPCWNQWHQALDFHSIKAILYLLESQTCGEGRESCLFAHAPFPELSMTSPRKALIRYFWINKFEYHFLQSSQCTCLSIGKNKNATKAVFIQPKFSPGPTCHVCVSLCGCCNKLPQLGDNRKVSSHIPGSCNSKVKVSGRVLSL